MVTQEIYTHLLVYFAIRTLINRAVEPSELDPDRVSFTASLRVVRRLVTDQAAFSPERLAAATADTTTEILQRLNNRRLRVNPRVIKRKMSKWPVKRATTGVLQCPAPIPATALSSPAPRSPRLGSARSSLLACPEPN